MLNFKGEGEQDTFTEEDYRRRKAHPNYKKQIFVEKMALRVKKPNLRTKVVSTGLTYGDGESSLDFLFKVKLKKLYFLVTLESLVRAIFTYYWSH